MYAPVCRLGNGVILLVRPRHFLLFRVNLSPASIRFLLSLSKPSFGSPLRSPAVSHQCRTIVSLPSACRTFYFIFISFGALSFRFIVLFVLFIIFSPPLLSVRLFPSSLLFSCLLYCTIKFLSVFFSSSLPLPLLLSNLTDCPCVHCLITCMPLRFSLSTLLKYFLLALFVVHDKSFSSLVSHSQSTCSPLLFCFVTFADTTSFRVFHRATVRASVFF